MFNSYKQTFGEPQGEASEDLFEVVSELFSEFDWNVSVAENTSKFKAKLDELLAPNEWVDDEGKEYTMVLDNNAKAHILQMSFHNANENFYELEDSGDMEDRFSAQDDFLEAIENALKQV